MPCASPQCSLLTATVCEHLQVASTNELTGVHKRLTNRVFAERDLPDFLVSDNYLKFSTCEECLNMPLDVLSTNFKLAAFKDGWQVCSWMQHWGW